MTTCMHEPDITNAQSQVDWAGKLVHLFLPHFSLCFCTTAALPVIIAFIQIACFACFLTTLIANMLGLLASPVNILMAACQSSYVK